MISGDILDIIGLSNLYLKSLTSGVWTNDTFKND